MSRVKHVDLNLAIGRRVRAFIGRISDVSLSVLVDCTDCYATPSACGHSVGGVCEGGVTRCSASNYTSADLAAYLRAERTYATSLERGMRRLAEEDRVCPCPAWVQPEVADHNCAYSVGRHTHCLDARTAWALTPEEGSE